MFRTADALTEARHGEGEMEMVGVTGGVGSAWLSASLAARRVAEDGVPAGDDTGGEVATPAVVPERLPVLVDRGFVGVTKAGSEIVIRVGSARVRDQQGWRYDD